jgi:hypothetical protein
MKSAISVQIETGMFQKSWADKNFVFSARTKESLKLFREIFRLFAFFSTAVRATDLWLKCD